MPFLTNPYPNAVRLTSGAIVDAGESVEVGDEEEAESLLAQGWSLAKSASDAVAAHPAKGRKADAPEVTPSAETDPALSGDEKE